VEVSTITVLYVTLPFLLPILLLIGSNVFMTLAWYGHLRFKETPLIGVILVSWGDRAGGVLHGRAGQPVGECGLFNCPAQDHPGDRHAPGVRRLLDSLSQGADDLELHLKVPMTWNYAVGFALVAARAYFIFRGPS
jgi:hypothetical protein